MAHNKENRNFFNAAPLLECVKINRIIKREDLHYINQCNKFESYLHADNLNMCLDMDLNPSTRTFVNFFSDYDLPLKKRRKTCFST